MGVGDRGAIAPDGLRLPTGHERVESSLGLAVGAVATEAAAVRAARQDDVQALAHVGVGTKCGETRDELLHGPQQQTHLGLGGSAGIGEGALDARSREREEQRRDERRLKQRGLTVDGRGLLMADPVDEGVEVREGAQVRRGDPQCGAAAGVGPVELLVELQALVVQTRGGRDDGGTCVEQFADDARCDGARRTAGDDRDIVRVLQGHGGTRGAGVFFKAQVIRDLCNFFAGARDVDLEILAVRDPREVLAGGGPTVVEKDGPVRIKGRCHEARPVGAELVGHEVRELIWSIGEVRGGPLDAELGEQRAGGLDECAVHLASELVEGSGVDNATGGTAGRRHSDVEADLLAGGAHSVIDEVVERRSVGRSRGQSGKVAAAQGGALARAENDLGGHAVHPAGAQAPRTGDAFRNVGRLLARRAGETTQGVRNLVGEHRAEGGVALGHAGDGLLEVVERGIGSALDGAEAELDAEVEQQLVAAGGHTLDEGLDGICGAHLVRANLGPHGDEHLHGIGGRKGFVRRRGGAPGSSGDRSRRCCRSGGRSRGLLGGSFLSGLCHGSSGGIGSILGEGLRAVALDVEDLDGGLRILRQAQGLAQHVGERR